MACYDSYDVLGADGCTIGSTAPKGWDGCGSCSYCCSDGSGFATSYSPELRQKLAEASDLADRLTDDLRSGEITEKQAWETIATFRGDPSDNG